MKKTPARKSPENAECRRLAGYRVPDRRCLLRRSRTTSRNNATKIISVPGLPDHPIRGHRPNRGHDAIAALRCGQHYKRLISTCWELGKHPDAASLGLNGWTHILGYRGHFLTKSRRYSVTFGQLRQARVTHRKTQRHPDGEKDPWGRDLDEHSVLVMASWHYAGTGHATIAERQLALAAAARAREHDQIAREETWTN